MTSKPKMISPKMQVPRVLLLLLLLSLIAPACSSRSIPSSDDTSGEKSRTFVHFSIAGLRTPHSTRVQGDTPSVGSDVTDHEDYIQNLAVLIYDASTGSLFHSHFTTLQGFVLQLSPEQGKKYHFLFLANFPPAWKDNLLSLSSYQEVTTRLKALQAFTSLDTSTHTLFHGATATSEYTHLFPMARIYEDQVIPTGGSITAPKLFKPERNPTSVLAPVSSWKDSWEETNTPHTVNLIRTSAKVSLNISGAGVKSITKVELHNAPLKHSYMEQRTSLPEPSPSPHLFMGSNSIDPSATNFAAKMYLPESLLGKASPTLRWDTQSDTPIGAISYISISMKSGKIYKIPVITANIPAGTHYLDVARNTISSTPADYSIVRNHHYHYEISVPEDGKLLHLHYRVSPWTLFQSEMSYERPMYDFRICVGERCGDTPPEGSEFQDINQEIELPAQEPATFYFKINKPKGALWQATITNGRDFELSGKTQGIVDETEGWYRFTLTPRYPFTTHPRFTQLYITVEGREIYLGYVEKSESTSTSPVIDNRYIGDGKPAQWKFKQVRGQWN